MDVVERVAGRKKAHTFRAVDEKRRIVEETLKSDVSVSSIARAYGVNANQVFQWRKLYRDGLLEVRAGRDRMRLLPVVVSEEAGPESAVALGAKRIEEPARVCSSTGLIDLTLARGQVRITGAIDAETLRTVLGCLLT